MAAAVTLSWICSIHFRWQARQDDNFFLCRSQRGERALINDGFLDRHDGARKCLSSYSTTPQ